MRIQHEEEIPASLGRAFDSGYLGDPDVVSGLVGRFCSSVERLLCGGAASKEDFVARSNALIRAHADIFAGRVAGYTPVEGYNSVTLPAKLTADLGEFWTKQRAKWNDDALCVFFEWLFVHAAEFVKRADGDDMLLEIMLKPTVQQAVRVLLGIEERQR